LIDKIHVIPNPISSQPKEVLNNEKENYIISIGRWEDSRKNKKVLIQTLIDIKSHENWKIIILGNGSLEIKSCIKKKKANIEIDAYEYVSHAEVYRLLRKSKIFLIPSLVEGFNVSACEAVISGCSIVGTPLECLKYLSKKGFSGNVSECIFVNSLGDLLDKEIVEWDIAKKYDPKIISTYWQHELGRAKVGALLRSVLF
jgi:glycosyltransferase involved in cell wall biosynthesis